jgi:hypothetical protein
MSSSTETDRVTEVREFADALGAAGRPCAVYSEKAQIWVPGVRGELMRFPLDCLEAPDASTLKDVHSQPGIKIASYMLPGDGARAANCFDYLCRDNEYDIEKLTKNGRRDIRRGQRSFEIRPCSAEEVVRDGFQAYCDTEGRHGHTLPEPADLEEFCRPDQNNRFVQYWAAWDPSGSLAAWIRVLKVDDWAFISTACSCNEALKNCPNNAVSYEATRTFLVDEKRSVVSYGISSLQQTSNILSLHRFKLRMGFEPAPKCRTFAVPPMLRPLLKWRVSSAMWDLASKACSGSVTLSKVAGLSRMLSGRAKDPLAWSRSDEK